MVGQQVLLFDLVPALVLAVCEGLLMAVTTNAGVLTAAPPCDAKRTQGSSKERL
jgi:hypothetical protein